MRNSGTCPKCQSKDLLSIPGGRNLSGQDNVIYTGMTGWSVVPVLRMVCKNCGFTEEWIDTQEDLDRLSGKFS